jgi:hypothetical protein
MSGSHTAAAATTKDLLLRIWSKRSLQKCLDIIAAGPFTNFNLDGPPDPGNWQTAYQANLLQLFQEQVACDVVFQIVADDTCNSSIDIGAHRCLLEARNFQPWLTAKNNNVVRNDKGQAKVLLVSGSQTKKEEEGRENEEIVDPVEVREAIASVYGRIELFEIPSWIGSMLGTAPSETPLHI